MKFEKYSRITLKHFHHKNNPQKEKLPKQKLIKDLKDTYTLKLIDKELWFSFFVGLEFRVYNLRFKV